MTLTPNNALAVSDAQTGITRLKYIMIAIIIEINQEFKDLNISVIYI